MGRSGLGGAPVKLPQDRGTGMMGNLLQVDGWGVSDVGFVKAVLNRYDGGRNVRFFCVIRVATAGTFRGSFDKKKR